MIDRIGQQITPGAFVVFGHNASRYTYLKVGKVVGFEAQGGVNGSPDEAIRTVALSRADKPQRKETLCYYPDRCVVIPYELFSPALQASLRAMTEETDQ